jgi:hypothetical protein
MVETTTFQPEASTQMKDRRTAKSYNLWLPVFIRVPIHSEAASRTGTTRDLSNRGVYFTIDNDFGIGAELALPMILPAESAGSVEVSIRAAGKVIRADKHSGNTDQKVEAAAMFGMCEIAGSEAPIA